MPYVRLMRPLDKFHISLTLAGAHYYLRRWRNQWVLVLDVVGISSYTVVPDEGNVEEDLRAGFGGLHISSRVEIEPADKNFTRTTGWRGLLTITGPCNSGQI